MCANEYMFNLFVYAEFIVSSDEVINDSVGSLNGIKINDTTELCPCNFL
jgi:hypothetical protein